MTDNLFNPEAFEQMAGQMSMEQPVCGECGHPLIRHYAHRMVDFPREQNGHCGDHTRCEVCESEQLPRNPFLASLSDESLRVMLARYGGPALEAARDEAARRYNDATDALGRTL